MPGREDVFQNAMNEGHSAAWDQKWAQAIEAYQKALAEFPENPKALTNLGLALYQVGRYEESLETYKRAAQFSPDDPLPPEKIAQLSERLGHLNQAVQAALQSATSVRHSLLKAATPSCFSICVLALIPSFFSTAFSIGSPWQSQPQRRGTVKPAMVK